MAQVGFYVGPGGVGVGVGAPGPDYGGCGYWNNYCNGYYDYYGGPDVVIGGGGWHGHPHFHGGTTIANAIAKGHQLRNSRKGPERGPFFFAATVLKRVAASLAFAANATAPHNAK